MKIESITIENFRGIRRVTAKDLGDTVIIAGQNGSGKSCVFDAIRLLKSVYGGYQQNEWQSWLGEFSIAPNASSESLRGMFNDPSKQILIECNISLDDSEKEFISNNAESLLTDATWRTILPEAFQFGAYHLALFASQFRDREPEVKARVEAELPGLKAELAQQQIIGHVTVPVGAGIMIRPSFLLPVVFTTYRPQEIGVVDYHGAQRHYGRELVQAVNISLDQSSQQQRQHALYNYSNKYNNIKSELAASYIKELFAKKAGSDEPTTSLTDTMKELFKTFFPDKTFEGPTPTPDGNLSFPVSTTAGTTHDLDDLSAGEKEILYGYLRIRNSAPKHSIILLDEPELHLNPRLIRNLPEFYRKHLGRALNNQIWLVSHSDALLREAVGKPGFDVFHMQAATSQMQAGFITSSLGQNQLKPLSATQDVDIALTDIVGDLAAYEPGRKAIIFEGGGDSDFDQSMTLRLFPELGKSINLVSGSNKSKVRALHEVLNRAHERGDLKTSFYAIVDRDFENPENSNDAVVKTFSWDVYHIENYLLDENAISHVVSSLSLSGVTTPEKVIEELRSAARETVPFAVRYRVNSYVSQQLIRAIDLSSNPAAGDFTKEILNAADRSLKRLSGLREGPLSDDAVRAAEQSVTDEIETAFADGSWRSRLPGRDILKAYAGRLANGISYETLRNMILTRMADTNQRPSGMATVIDQIVAA
ncbi:AAA family ATPase [Novosphingobium sp. Leaf2]|uniref:AAA family ATPase n=1 Tax=Novosphingobium sp. Leaf2 TaxID=1735670 RepID=UPI00138F31A1|nr:AAA family ATPase [Novosphingobium sp. Leaf2]